MLLPVQFRDRQDDTMCRLGPPIRVKPPPVPAPAPPKHDWTCAQKSDNPPKKVYIQNPLPYFEPRSTEDIIRMWEIRMAETAKANTELQKDCLGRVELYPSLFADALVAHHAQAPAAKGQGPVWPRL
jgi:hypothetical protein